jgi:hypothetical protein
VFDNLNGMHHGWVQLAWYRVVSGVHRNFDSEPDENHNCSHSQQHLEVVQQNPEILD